MKPLKNLLEKQKQHTSDGAVKALIYLVKIYQKFISPLTGPSCRFLPTCSCYTREALMRYGFCKGLRLSFFRFLRCNPFTRAKYDPIPMESVK